MEEKMKGRTAFVLLLVVSLLLPVVTACTTPTPEVVEKVVVVEAPKEVVVEIEKIVTATPVPPTPVPPPPTIRMYFVPSGEADTVLASGDKIAAILEERTGYKFETAVPTSYAAVIEALCTGKADVAWLATFAYVLANAKCGVEAKLTTVRYGASTYTAEIIAQSDAARAERGLDPISSLDDLNGKTFAFTDPLSTSGYLFARAMLEDAGVELAESIFAGGHPQAVLAVYNGDVDAGAAYWSAIRPDGSLGDARRTALESYPDVGEKVKIVRLSDPIPNDTVSFRADLPEDVKDKLIAAILAMTKTDEGIEVLGELYNITGLVPASDADYDVVRKMGDLLGFDFEKALEE
jgi:phosphonate transport system substrate-binding protein